MIRRRQLLGLVVTVFCMLGPAIGKASVMSEGQAPFWLSTEFMGPRSADGTLRLGLNVGGLYAAGVPGVVHVQLPPGLKLVSGDSSFVSQLSTEDRVHTIVVRPERDGLFKISTSLRVDNGSMGIDVGEVVVTLTARGDSVQTSGCRTIREERFRGGGRFRFGGAFLVPLDTDEPPASENDIQSQGQSVGIVKRLATACADCPEKGPGGIQWIVFLGRDGRIRDARPADVGPADSAAVAHTRDVLSKWSFRPAELNGAPVSDWIVVTVPVQP